MSRVVFHRDGRIVARTHGRPDRVLEPTDPLALAAHLRSVVTFEDGLRPCDLMRCLAPWGAFLSRAGWCDFHAWHEAICRPPLRLARPGDVEETRVERVVLHPAVRTHIPHRDLPELEIAWEASAHVGGPHGTGRLEEVNQLDPRLWSRRPLVIETRPQLFEFDLSGRQRSLFSDRVGIEADGGSRMTIRPTLFDTVVLGFLDDVSFHGQPAATRPAADVAGRSGGGLNDDRDRP
jgi:hypothetical protein